MSDSEELKRLAREALDKASPALTALLAAARAGDHPSTCTWCPLCTAVGLLRGERPELAAAIVTHAEGLVSALRVALHQPAEEPAGPAEEPAGPPHVQHIPVRPC
jgi:hypothetical protein